MLAVPDEERMPRLDTARELPRHGTHQEHLVMNPPRGARRDSALPADRWASTAHAEEHR